jgi:hypothetical protein
MVALDKFEQRLHALDETAGQVEVVADGGLYGGLIGSDVLDRPVGFRL